MKQKIRREKVNNQTAKPKGNAFVFLFFPLHIKKTILASRTNNSLTNAANKE
jgi:hypothetical protein